MSIQTLASILRPLGIIFMDIRTYLLLHRHVYKSAERRAVLQSDWKACFRKAALPQPNAVGFDSEIYKASEWMGQTKQIEPVGY